MSLDVLGDWRVLSPLLIAGAAGVLIGLERLFPYDPGQRLFRKGWFNDFFLYTLAQSYVLGLVIDAIIRAIDGAVGPGRFRLVEGWPVWAQLLFFFVVHDFYIYWFHRLQHWSPILWRTHEAHHSVEDVDWLAGSRSHPIEILINQTVEFAPIVLLGAAPEVALMKATLDAVWGMYIHSNIDVRTGPLQYVINGPEMHRWHHSGVFTGYGFNFGTKLAVWDWLFGTAYRPAGEKPPCYGLVGVDFPEGYLRQILAAFRRPGGVARDATDDAPQTCSTSREGAPETSTKGSPAAV
ncbi:sterol desaturase family protein [Sorangium sp. So ce426]|uniref:sterol desaturase family protein n=1 Tax=unclassified Sorangium TaxID=2621164 RepID=UPI003F5C5A23